MNYREPSMQLVYQKQIELIIVITVIGILIAIATRIFSEYRDKALLMNVLGEQKIITQDLSLYYSINGVWPEDKDGLDTFISSLWGIEEVDQRFDSNPLIEMYHIEKGAVHYKFKDHVLGQDETVTLRPAVPANNVSGPVIWVCKDERDPSLWTVSGEDKTTVPDEIISSLLK